MSHRNAPLSETGRLRLARCVVDDGWSYRRAAERFQVSPPTAKRWAERYREQGRVGMRDRSSRPRHSPRRTERAIERRIVRLRCRKRFGPARLAGYLGMAPSTVHAVLRRYRAPRLHDIDRVSGQPIRRYEHPAPGDLIHVDVKKLGKIPDGGGWRAHDRAKSQRNAKASTTARRPSGRARVGYRYLHTALDDHSRLAYTEILPDERKHTVAGFWARATTWFTSHGIDQIKRVLTDNARCYGSDAWRDAVNTTGTRHLRTRPYRPQTNGKVERYHRILVEEWCYSRAYLSEDERAHSLPDWLHRYNHHRHHTAIGGPPASRVTNLPGQYN
jgi:transposase InsO family protein